MGAKEPQPAPNRRPDGSIDDAYQCSVGSDPYPDGWDTRSAMVIVTHWAELPEPPEGKP